jgi:hypothetical protein
VQDAVWVPSQAPPQAVPSEAQAVRVPWGAPLVGEHVPMEPVLSQAWHWPPQAVSQHTPSTQLPDVH